MGAVVGFTHGVIDSRVMFRAQACAPSTPGAVASINPLDDRAGDVGPAGSEAGDGIDNDGESELDEGVCST